MSATCRWCPGASSGAGPCPLAFICPTCGAAPGKRCQRPSEHTAWEEHAPRLALEHDYTLADLDAQLDAALDRRVAAHQARKADTLTVKAYLAELAEVRDLEDYFEPLRRQLGATQSRAGELVDVEWPYTWYWRGKHGDRHGKLCRVWARGTMNSIGVEFVDGFRTVTARYAVRKRQTSPEPRVSAPLPPLAQQLDLDGGLHDLAPQTRQERLFTPDTQLAGQTYLDTRPKEH